MLTLPHRNIRIQVNPFIKIFTSLKKNSRFIQFVFFPEKPLGKSEKAIIKAIHTLRFNSQNPYIITGSHFADIYTRNIGIFYNAALDGRVFLSDEDWLQRQYTYAKTVAINLELLRQSEKTYTTFMPVDSTSYVPINIYTEPSDSLFGILWGLLAMQDGQFIFNMFPSSIKCRHQLETKKIAQELLAKYATVLKKELRQYIKEILDKNALVKKNIFLSSARDGVRRESSFYDNVIAWATMFFADSLGLKMQKRTYFENWKQQIIDVFWSEEEGIFLDDLSQESKRDKIFCGDSFIVLGSLFFNIDNEEDRKKLSRMIMYVKRNKLDQPFPLSYSKKNQPKKTYWPVRFFAKSYSGEAIWSHWGMEYIKALILLSRENEEFLDDAKKHMQSYKRNIEKYGGYPELYNKKGNIFKTPFYKSVLHTSWVVNYEQTKMLLEDIKK